FLAGAAFLVVAAFLAGAFLAAGAFFVASLRTIVTYFFFLFGLSAAFRVELGENRSAVDAAIFPGSPVCGLRPVRAARFEVLQEPNPGQATFSPFLALLTTASKNAPIVRSASALVTPAAFATPSISSALVAICPLSFPVLVAGVGARRLLCRWIRAAAVGDDTATSADSQAAF